MAKAILYEENHKITECRELLKKCNHHHIFFPNEDPWMPCTDEYFYKTNKNKKDGLHPECRRCCGVKAFKWQKSNPERYLEVHRKNYYDDWEAEREKDKAYKQEHKDHIREYNEGYRQTEAFKQSVKKSQQFRNTHKKHEISTKEWIACKNYFDNCCAYCGKHIKRNLVMRKGELKQFDLCKDHVENYGENDLSNCIPGCWDCNTSKRITDFDKWYNEDNPVFSQERLSRILKWLDEDYKLYIEGKKPRKPYIRRK